jgi:Holliday junction resolvase RusA-like endonuclease
MMFTIQGRLRSKKNGKQIGWVNGKPRVFSNGDYRRWERSAVEQLQTQMLVMRAETIKRPAKVRVAMWVYLAKGQRMDRDNLRQGVFDALERAGVVENDSQIVDDPLTVGRDWDEPRVEVEVVEISGS